VAFNTVGDLITQVRVLLQDVDSDRYSDAMMVQALNEGLLETRRLRPDLFRGRMAQVPQYTTAQLATRLAYEQMYMPALVNFVAGRVQLQDQEEFSDARAGVFINSFTARLVGGA
jgi:hypothetical protein